MLLLQKYQLVSKFVRLHAHILAHAHTHAGILTPIYQVTCISGDPLNFSDCWMDKVTNEDVLKKVNESKNMLNVLRQWKRKWVGHVLRHDEFL